MVNKKASFCCHAEQWCVHVLSPVFSWFLHFNWHGFRGGKLELLRIEWLPKKRINNASSPQFREEEKG